MPNQTLMDGINAARKTIPFARFDKSTQRRASNACAPTAPSGTGRPRAFKNTQITNWASHGADALALPVDRVARSNAGARAGAETCRHIHERT